MRNVFDQYSQAENRLTHALFSALDQDRRLLAAFLEEVCGVTPPSKAKDLRISVQQYPGGREYSEKELEARNIPDAWIFDEDRWALVFEAKITAKLTRSQLEGHQRTAARFGFEQTWFFAVVAADGMVEASGWTTLKWADIYRWLRSRDREGRLGQTDWAETAAGYFEVLEADLVAKGKLDDLQITAFSGFFASEADYSYAVAKNRLRNAMRELRKNPRLLDEPGIDTDAPGRGAITGRDADIVWDFLRLSAASTSSKSTEFPHLTLGVGRRYTEAMVTFPNGLRTRSRKRLLGGGFEGFLAQCRKVLENVQLVLAKEPHARPMVRAMQRRYPSQRSTPIRDAILEFDLRTAFPGKKTGPKAQPQWMEALFDAVSNKRSNLQFQVGVMFDYAKCPSTQAPEALELIADAWISCKPLIERALR